MSRYAPVCALLLIPASLAAQAAPVRWAVDPTTSLAWWQIDPHYEHLWATTCPDDPSWQPGEGRSPRYSTDYSTRPKTFAAGRSDPRIPLFPRVRVRADCRRAVQGELVAQDSITWRAARGRISVLADSLVTGLDVRDLYARRAVLETKDYPEITFTLDSLVELQPGDTLHAVAVGTFTIHGTTHPLRAPVVAWREAAGLRVRAQFHVDALVLVDDYNMSKWALGMGVLFKRWRTVHMGVDLVLRPEA